MKEYLDAINEWNYEATIYRNKRIYLSGFKEDVKIFISLTKAGPELTIKPANINDLLKAAKFAEQALHAAIEVFINKGE